MLSALLMSLVLGVGLVVVNNRGPSMRLPANAKPMTDEQSRDRLWTRPTDRHGVPNCRMSTAGYIFLSCTNEHDPPYQAAVYLNFHLSAE